MKKKTTSHKGCFQPYNRLQTQKTQSIMGKRSILLKESCIKSIREVSNINYFSQIVNMKILPKTRVSL